MVQYIDKAALVAEIERRRQELRPTNTHQMKVDEKMDRDVLMWLNALAWVKKLLDTLEVKEVQEEPISNDLEEAASQYPSAIRTISPQWESELENAFKAGAEWKKEQFEKNRIEHCDSITEEQYNLETGFIDYYIDKYNRMPTFLDAIEYGMKKAMEE